MLLYAAWEECPPPLAGSSKPPVLRSDAPWEVLLLGLPCCTVKVREGQEGGMRVRGRPCGSSSSFVLATCPAAPKHPIALQVAPFQRNMFALAVWTLPSLLTSLPLLALPTERQGRLAARHSASASSNVSGSSLARLDRYT